MYHTKYNSRAFARLGQSGAIFGMCLPDMHERYPIVVLSADMSAPAGLDRYKRSFPGDFYNVGIAEQNMMGVAAGLSSEGLLPVCVAQGCFVSMRSFEQVRQYMGYMHYPIILVGINSGFSLTFFGNTHYAIEDLALMRSIPDMLVLSPADAGEAVKVFEKALSLKRPTYIRLTGGMPTPIVYNADFDYDPFKMTKVSDHGNDAVLFATGSMVHQSIVAAETLKAAGVNVRVYDVSCIKPIDAATIEENIDAKAIVTVEEHSVVGGLGSAVAEVLAAHRHHPPLTRIGVADTFSAVGDYQWLLDYHGLTAEKIHRRVCALNV